jgi:RNA polymerase sigma-70 factor, ECF subfamily
VGIALLGGEPMAVQNKQSSIPRLSARAASKSKLVAHAQQGEEGAFVALYEIHKAKVYTICLRLAGSRKCAEKLSHDVFLWIFRNISAFEDDEEFGAVLERLAIRLAIAFIEQHASSDALSSTGQPVN